MDVAILPLWDLGFLAAGLEESSAGLQSCSVLLSCGTGARRDQSSCLFASHLGLDFKGKPCSVEAAAVSSTRGMPYPLSRTFY